MTFPTNHCTLFKVFPIYLFPPNMCGLQQKWPRFSYTLSSPSLVYIRNRNWPHNRNIVTASSKIQPRSHVSNPLIRIQLLPCFEFSLIQNMFEFSCTHMFANLFAFGRAESNDAPNYSNSLVSLLEFKWQRHCSKQIAGIELHDYIHHILGLL